MVAVMNKPGKPAEVPREALGARLDYRHIWFNAVLGGLGGLLGWAGVVLLTPLFAALLGAVFAVDSKVKIYFYDALIGPVIGISIGLAIGSTEGLIASRSLRRVLRGGSYGAALGAVGGFVGLVVGEVLFNLADALVPSLARLSLAAVWLRASGWAIFGAFVGTSDGFAQKLPAKIRYGVLGGILGGLVGGGTYEGLLQVMRTAENRGAALAWGSAIGLIVLGACIGALVALVESILRKAWVRFTSGRLEGQTRTLDSSRPQTLGSYPACTIVIPEDATIAPLHAEIAFNGPEEVVVRAREGKVLIRRDGREAEVQTHVLRVGDSIRIGDSRMIFRNEEKKS